MRRTILHAALAPLFAAALASAPAAASAQTGSIRAAVLLEPGTRVRLTHAGEEGWIAGTLVGAAGDSLVVRTGRDRGLLVLHRGEVGAMQVSLGRRSRAGKYAVRAGLAGAAVGALVGLAAARGQRNNDYGWGLPGTVATLTILLAVPSAAGGALAGALHPEDRWLPAAP